MKRYYSFLVFSFLLFSVFSKTSKVQCATAPDFPEQQTKGGFARTVFSGVIKPIVIGTGTISAAYAKKMFPALRIAGITTKFMFKVLFFPSRKMIGFIIHHPYLGFITVPILVPFILSNVFFVGGLGVSTTFFIMDKYQEIKPYLEDKKFQLRNFFRLQRFRLEDFTQETMGSLSRRIPPLANTRAKKIALVVSLFGATLAARAFLHRQR
ncbi:hypothetical protein HN446_02815 [bacterium]|nr:hypothetical protein [bacterium]